MLCIGIKLIKGEELRIIGMILSDIVDKGKWIIISLIGQERALNRGCNYMEFSRNCVQNLWFVIKKELETVSVRM